MARENLGAAPAVNNDQVRKTDLDIGLATKQATGNYVTALTGDVTASGPGSVAATIANDAVTNAKLTNMNQATFKMRAAGAGTGDPIDGTAAQAKTALAIAGTDVAFTPSGQIAATTVQAAIAELISEAFPLGWGAWTSYTPVLGQGAATPNIAKTVSYATYTKVGRLVIGAYLLAVTGTGTAANRVTVSLPLTAAGTAFSAIGGTGAIFDASASETWTGLPRLETTTALSMLNTRANGILGSGGFTAALANTDAVTGTFIYEATS